MILSIVVIAFALGLTYLQYLQGAFTAAISLACALAGVLVAFGYYENVVGLMNQTGFADYAGGMSLVVLFSITFFALRAVADSVVPGNIALSLYVEKTCAVLFGFGASLLAAGTFAVGMQMMPLGVSVAGFAPYATETGRPVHLPAAVIGQPRDADMALFEEMTGDSLGDRQSLLLPADNLVLSLVKTASDGAFSGGQSFATIHPDLGVEAFMIRVGAEGSGKHVILNNAKAQNVKLDGLYILTGLPTPLDAEDAKIRKAPLTFKMTDNQRLVVVRAEFTDPAADKDAYVRLTPAAARLVIGDKTYYPIGTMEGTKNLALNRLDDLLPIPVKEETNAADLVYVLPKLEADKLAKPATDEAGPRFVELKMFGRIDLSTVTSAPFTPAKNVRVLRKPTSPLGLATKKSAPL